MTKFRKRRALRPRPAISSKKVGLKYRGIAPVTRQRYEKQLRQFFEYIRHMHIPFPKSWRDLDQRVAEYIDHMFLEGEPVGYAGDLLSGMSRFMPGARLRMPTARLWFRNWTREVVRKRALPIPVSVVKGLVGIALAMDRLDLAAIVGLGFLCMLRTSEMYNLRVRDVAFGPGLATAVIALPQTKTSGPNTDEVVLRHSRVVRALHAVFSDLEQNDVVYAKAS